MTFNEWLDDYFKVLNITEKPGYVAIIPLKAAWYAGYQKGRSDEKESNKK